MRRCDVVAPKYHTAREEGVAQGKEGRGDGKFEQSSFGKGEPVRYHRVKRFYRGIQENSVVQTVTSYNTRSVRENLVRGSRVLGTVVYV